MIAHLRGRLLSKTPQTAVVEAAGVGYEVTISIPTFTALPAEGNEVALLVYTHVREDALALFGFTTATEKRLFEKLLSISGIGPKLAITVLSGLPPERLIAAIHGQDHATLTRIPGVGKKTAERIVLELKDKLKELAPTTTAGVATPVSEDVLSALVNLGYPRATAQKGVEDAIARTPEAGGDFETLFRAAMAAMQ
ncbi:MAG TPA: Holliday junction branch migration protein RuvA [Acidobacteriaceae bacterium]|nr:Holliday junction branch migration protein RuvA [Terriglobia bacterium]HVC91691.1 Holliday junction branch migration protein RuvA [Acidobacteriaceae bacterium]